MPKDAIDAATEPTTTRRLSTSASYEYRRRNIPTNSLTPTTKRYRVREVLMRCNALMQVLSDFVDTIGCDRATLMFVDAPSQVNHVSKSQPSLCD